MFLRSMFPFFGLWTSELCIFDIKFGFYVKLPPWGRVLRSQIWRGCPKTGHWKANRAKKIIGGVHDRQNFLTDFTHNTFFHFFDFFKHFVNTYV